jgi:cytochrome b6-f complex iron-sulfur subunit
MKRRTPRHIEAVLTDRRLPNDPIDDPDDAAALALAIELRAARPGAGQPDERFVTELRRRLVEQNAPPVRHRLVTRRAAITATAGALAGAAAALVAVEARPGTTDHLETSQSIVLPDGQWIAVASAAQFANEPVQRFATETITGFVSLTTDGTPIAVSGACTHQGCLLRLNNTERRLDCPCHRTAFTPDGHVLFHQLPAAPAPLPHLHVRRNADTIEAFLPPHPAS